MNKIVELVQKYTPQRQTGVGKWTRLCQVLAGTRDQHRAMEVLSHYTNEELVYLLEHRTDRTYSPEHEYVIHTYRSAQVGGNQALGAAMNTLVSERAKDMYGVLVDVFTTAHHIHSQIVDAVQRIYGNQYTGVPHMQLFAR